MALSDYAAFLAWATAALVLYAGVASRRDWVRRYYRSMAAVMLVAGLLVQGAAAPKSGGPHATDVEAEAAAGRAPRDFPYFTQLAICFPCLVLIACVAVELRKARTPPPPPQSVPARRYAERRRA